MVLARDRSCADLVSKRVCGYVCCALRCVAGKVIFAVIQDCYRVEFGDKKCCGCPVQGLNCADCTAIAESRGQR